MPMAMMVLVTTEDVSPVVKDQGVPAHARQASMRRRSIVFAERKLVS